MTVPYNLGYPTTRISYYGLSAKGVKPGCGGLFKETKPSGKRYSPDSLGYFVLYPKLSYI